LLIDKESWGDRGSSWRERRNLSLEMEEELFPPASLASLLPRLSKTFPALSADKMFARCLLAPFA